MRQTKAQLELELSKQLGMNDHLKRHINLWKGRTLAGIGVAAFFALMAGYGQHQYNKLEESTAKLIHIIQTEPEAFCPSSSGGFEIIPSEPQEATPAPPSSGSAPSLACPDGNCLTTPHSF